MTLQSLILLLSEFPRKIKEHKTYDFINVIIHLFHMKNLRLLQENHLEKRAQLENHLENGGVFEKCVCHFGPLFGFAILSVCLGFRFRFRFRFRA